ncbi:kelch repeat domain-containing protein [Naegleria gruberi]|uniref:Kelch repeat domain-containing protein n=1 Tax=Naegleria gruberi TaxID=5762 RepID=D2V4S6_NAEGR|nr:kelch repeat domain-containing protein [Naegleria gruberi]EFC47985.1 kelch repeat domain-containing protein [Naegleria gruberi]|eukprot:XP_002680729.1 kelch repeat domain-containing protein [Naegleria gruberi strain NEG-M]
MPPNQSSSSSSNSPYMIPPHLATPSHHHERHSSEYSEESTILTTRGDNHFRNNSQPASFTTNNLASRSKSNPPVGTKIYGQGMPIPFGVLDSYTPPPLKSSNSTSNVNTKSPSIPPSSPSTIGKNKKEEIQINNTSEWFTLTTQNHDSLFPLEGHQIFYWEQCLEDEDDLTSSVESTSIFNRSLNMIVLFGGTGPIRGNTNQIYCMVQKHSSINSKPTTNISNSQSCSHQWIPVPSHYIPNYFPPSLTSASSNDIEKLERKSSKSNILSNSNQGASSPRRSSFELSSIAEDGSTEIPLYKSRYDHSLVLCGNNKAYLFGGRNGMFTKTPLQDFILYSLDMDISNQFTWEMAHIPPKNDRDPSILKQSQRGLDDLYNRESPIPRYGHSCCAVNQKQSVLQRSNSTNTGSSQAIIELNSESDTLSDLSIGGLNNNFESNSSSASTGSTRFNTDGGVVLDCAMLLFGGVAFTDYSGSKKCKETNDFWMFNCKERKWLSYPSIIQRYFKNSSSILQFKTDDKYMQEISLSSSASGTSSSNSESRKQTKKPANNNIISIHSSFVPEARYGHQMCVVSNSLIFVIGGATLNKDAMYKDVWVLSLSTFEWRKVNLLHNKNNEQFINKIPIRYASHVVVGRRILLYGGQLSYKTGDYLTELLCFDTETYRFSIIENSISPKFDTGLVKATMILYGIDLLIIGGKRGVSSYRYNDSVQAFSFKLHSISKTNQKFIRENTKMKKSNQILTPNEITFEIPTFGDEDDEFDIANSVKIDLISQILLSEMSSSDFSRKEALKYLSEVKQIDIVKQLFRNNSIHKALSIIMQSGSKSDIRQTAKVLIRYFKDTDQGTLPFIIARQVLKFIESYLTLINTLIKLREPISQTLHLDYLNLFHLMCQNFEYYESLSKELISVFQQCFKLSDPLSKASLDILQLAVSSVEFLSLNAMHFASKCDKETSIIFRDFITLCNEAKSKTAKNLEDNPIEMQGSILKLDELVNKLRQSLFRLSSRSKPIKKYLGKLLKRSEEDDDDM